MARSVRCRPEWSISLETRLAELTCLIKLCSLVVTPISGCKARTCAQRSGMPVGPGLAVARSGGGLARRDITLLVSCSDQGAQVPAGAVDGPASRAELAQAVARLVNGPEKNRLYVYFAGHGCRTDPLNPLKSRDAILLTDFTPDDPAAGSVGVEDLQRRLTMAPFQEVILIVDACRNLPFREPFDLGGLGRDLPPRAGGSGGASRVYVLQATAPGEKAVGAGQDGELRGVVSRALTDGLRGIGAAKVFDDTDSTGRPYQVRWSTLCSYVADSVTGQDPRYYGEGDLVLTAFPDGSFDQVRLVVDVDPGSATDDDLAQLYVQVTWPVFDVGADGALDRPGPAPVTLDVPPRRHRIMAGQAGWLRNDRSMYMRTRVFRWHWNGHGRPEAGLDHLLPSQGPARCRVGITSDDPASVLQMRDGSGAVRGTDVGRLSAELAPGSYTAVAIGMDGTETRQPADLFPGESPVIELSTVAPGGWPFRSGQLAWASPAAWIAGADPDNWWAARSGSGIVVAVAEADQEIVDLHESVTLTPMRSRPENRPMLVYTHLVHGSSPRPSSKYKASG